MTKTFQPRSALGHTGMQFLKAVRDTDKSDPKQVSLLYDHLKVVAQLEQRIAGQCLKQYRAAASQMMPYELMNEKGSSRLLRKHMADAGIQTPKYCHAHHIVPSHEHLSFPARMVLAAQGIPINDEINGTALPGSQKVIDNNLAQRLHSNRVPHLNLGKESYINGWVNREINPASAPTRQATELQLRIMQFRLETGTHPRFITESAGDYAALNDETLIELDDEGIEALEYDDDGQKTAQFLVANPQFKISGPRQ